jgi:hypothetical protein
MRSARVGFGDRASEKTTRQSLTYEASVDTTKANRTSVMLRKALYLFVIGARGVRGAVGAGALRMRQVSTFFRLAVVAWGLVLGGNLLAATVPPGFTETTISGPWINAVGSAFESNGRMSYGV